MSAFKFRRRRTRRWWYGGITVLVIAAFAVLYVGGASANLSGSTFEGGDANLIVDHTSDTDWANVASPEVGIDKPTGSTDNSFGQGTKEDNSAVTVVNGSIPPNKSDLTRFYEASELASNNVYLYLAWERSNVLGNANMDFEINQNETNGCPGTSAGACTIHRTNGDVLVTYDFPGSGSPTLGILRWLVSGMQNPDQTNHPGANTAGECFSANTLPCWGDQMTLNSTNSEGAVNTTTVADPIPPNATRNLPAGTFGEAAINLTGAGVVTQSNGCQFGQATTFLKSRSSSSFTSEIKDFISPVQTPIFANCGAIKITKESSKAAATPLQGAQFEITGPNNYDQTFSTDSNGVICVDSLVFGSYSITETKAPDGYAIDNGNAVAANVSSAGSCPSTGTIVTKDFTDTPLTDVTVEAKSEASGGTKSTITCVTDGTSTAMGNSPQGPAEDAKVSATGLSPGTYDCTVVVDP